MEKIADIIVQRDSKIWDSDIYGDGDKSDSEYWNNAYTS